MKAVKLSSTRNMTRDEWLALRKKGITGTRISGIMNVSPWETPRSVYCDLLGLKPDKEQTEPMYWGTILEDVIAKEFQTRTGLKVRRVNYVLQHPTYEFLLGNVDREIRNGRTRGILEVKNVNAYAAEEWKNGAPEHYVMQLQFYLALTGYSFGYLTALVGGQKLIYHRIERDEMLIAEMIDAATEFWFEHVEPQVEPPVTERDTELLNAMFSQVDPSKVLHLTDDIDAHKIALLRKYKERLNDDEILYEQAENHLKDMMRDADQCYLNGELVATWKANKNGRRSFRLL